MIETCKHENKIRIIQSNRPNIPKLNNDGSALNNPRSIGRGGTLRDNYENMVYAFTIPFRMVTTYQEEPQITTHGIAQQEYSTFLTSKMILFSHKANQDYNYIKSHPI